VDFDIVQMEWGFIPDSWFGKPLDTLEKVKIWRDGYKDPLKGWVKGITTLNAVGEEMLLKNKIYRDSALYRRCLVLSTGFYEWRHYFPPNKRTGLPTKTANKIPHYITVKDKAYFFMAGIYKPWTDKESGETINTVSICTTAAPEGHLMAKVHNSKLRMPTILNEDLAYEWLFEPMSEERITEVGTTVFPSDQMAAFTIAKDFKTVYDPTTPFEYQDVPALDL